MNDNPITNRPAQAADWAPAVDIVELKDRYVLSADLPGVLPESIEISLKDQVLTLEGLREDRAAGGRRHYQERASGRFLRRFTLPATIDGDAIEAKSTHGTLEISVPKQARVTPRRISVEAA